MAFTNALSGMNVSSTDLEVTSNNIANASTDGFKKAESIFADIYRVSSLGVSGNTPGSGVRIAGIRKDFSQGGMNFTNNPLDLAISGTGFFVMQDLNARTYTRSGAFGTDNAGTVVNQTGQNLLGFQVDSTGTSTGVLAPIIIDRSDAPPQSTANATLTVNLNSSEVAPQEQWLGTDSFGGAIPDSDTYNQVSSMAIFDSVGFEHILTSYFVKTDTSNTWHARFQIDGLDVGNPAPRANLVASAQPSLVPGGSLATLDAGDLTINGTAIPAGVADGISLSDSTASARAIATAINTETATTGVTATPDDVVLNLGSYVPGTLAAGQFTINGVNIVVATATQTGLINAVNAQTGATGVTATTNSSGNILLTLPSTHANAGSNIYVTTNGAAATANFSNFPLTAAATAVQRGTYNLTSNGPITIAGSLPVDANLTANTYTAPWVLTFNPDGTINPGASDNIALSWTPLDTNGNPNGSVSPQTIAIDLDSSTQFGSPFSVQTSTQDGYTSGRLSQIEVDENGYVNARYSNGQSQVLAQVALAFFENESGLSPLGDTAWGETFNSGQPVISAPGTSSLGKLQSGAREASNVDLTDELVALIINQRDFQANAKSIETASTITQTIINIR